MKFKTLALLCVTGILLVATGCSSQPQQQSTPKTSSIDKSSAGYQVFSQTCASCHGADLQGMVGPDLTQVGARMSKDQIQTQILNGGGGMPGFKDKLSSQQVSDLVDFLSKLK